jgi:hypothetical protein
MKSATTATVTIIGTLAIVAQQSSTLLGIIGVLVVGVSVVVLVQVIQFELISHFDCEALVVRGWWIECDTKAALRVI